LAGLVLAFWGMALLTNLQPAQIRELVTLYIDRTVLLFSFAVAVTTGLLFGLAPAWQLANGDSAEALKEGGRSESGAGGRFGGGQSGGRSEGEPPARPGQGRLSDFAIVTPDYFKTMGVIILKGRAFTEADLGSDRVCIVDETFERKHFNGDALGKRLANGGD